MLACLPASGDSTITLLSCTQMNTGLQKWETTQKMGSASYPTPAQLDAYAKKVANSPLTIQIFPNSIKVPQRKHLRRTVNGLDTSLSAPRHSPYPTQVSSNRGLLAVLRAPSKDGIKEPGSGRARQLQKATMNPHNGSYAAHSTLNLPQSAHNLRGSSRPAVETPQKQSMVHPQTLQLQRSLSQPMAPAMPHPQALQQKGAPHLQHSQGLAASQTLAHAAAGPPAMTNALQQPPPGTFGPRKLPDADAPPNVTVSTSTIPLSMAASLHQNRAGSLSSIVHQINQLCQARAGMGATSVCEGQIANPSPISRNLLINASSRVSSLQPGLASVPGGLLMGAADHAAAQSLHAPPAMAVNAFLPEPEKVHSWAQHQLDHRQQLPEGAHPCKTPRMERPPESDFPPHGLAYPHKLPAQFALKQRADRAQPSSPVRCPAAPMPYANGHYLQPPWSRVPVAAGNAAPGPRDLPAAFQPEPMASATERTAGAKYRPMKEDVHQAKLMKSVDFLGQDFHLGGFQEQRMEVMEKMHRSAMGHIQEVSSGAGLHPHPPGYH
uniref:Family with sequence similarity 222 member B n=1 Tax=Tetraodon nigroviridis TaxID=99883 RepID=H3CLS6_TETNG